MCKWIQSDFNWRSIRYDFPNLINFHVLFSLFICSRGQFYFVIQFEWQSLAFFIVFFSEKTNWMNKKQRFFIFYFVLIWMVAFILCQVKCEFTNTELFSNLIKSPVNIIDEWHIVTKMPWCPRHSMVGGSYERFWHEENNFVSVFRCDGVHNFHHSVGVLICFFHSNLLLIEFILNLSNFANSVFVSIVQ